MSCMIDRKLIEKSIMNLLQKEKEVSLQRISEHLKLVYGINFTDSEILTVLGRLWRENKIIIDVETKKKRKRRKR